jgi:hypothetical protein
MNGWTIYPSINDRNSSASVSPGGDERRRVVEVEILLAGFRIPDFIEYSAEDDFVTFTIKKGPNSSIPENSRTIL